ncbi:E3 ubiquitin-protein ligase TRIM21-like [Neosynchiropus ocellatus]
MTSQSASPVDSSKWDQSLITCPICTEVFTEPVTTHCGHSFCRVCLQRAIDLSIQSCPLCKEHLKKPPQVSIILRDIISQIKSSLEQKAKKECKPGEVACDICTERKMKAKKSCLVCLSSFCSTHLENHLRTTRLKGHKLVEPVENLDERACAKHWRPLELYSRGEQKCICTLCMKEGLEDVVSIDEEWSKRKAEIEQVKTELGQKVKSKQRNVEDINDSRDFCKNALEEEWFDVEGIFTATLDSVEQTQKTVLQPMTDRRQVLEKEAKAITDDFEADICRLEKAITDLDKVYSLEDPIQFLQNYPPLQDLESIEGDMKVSYDTSLCFGSMRKPAMMMRKQIEKEMERLTAIVDVRLDPESAHKQLLLSEDGQQVQDSGEEQERADSPERFDLFASVLGVNTLSGGKAYWEVDVGEKTGWDVGVTSVKAKRKGKLSLNPENGYWVIVHYDEHQFAAMTDPPTLLNLKQKPARVGVFVDHDDGLVSFYNLTDKSHIFTFDECSFSEWLLPYLSPHLKQGERNSAPLKICSVGRDKQSQDSSKGMNVSVPSIHIEELLQDPSTNLIDVDVKLDPETAHSCLAVSPDGKNVKDGGHRQEGADSPKKFSLFGSVLGSNGFTSGKCYWEVEVTNKTGWDLGVASGKANRKGKINLDSGNGYWVIVHYDGSKYAALSVPATSLSLKSKPERVGVFVDYEDGLVSFYNVTDQSHIYSYTGCAFTEEIYPYFSPHLRQNKTNADPLVICPVKK